MKQNRGAMSIASAVVLPTSFVLGLALIYNSSPYELPSRLDLNTVSGLSKRIEIETDKKLKKQNGRPGYFHALKWRTERVSYPYDRPDSQAIPNALRHAENMPSARLVNDIATRSTPFRAAAAPSARAWEFVGPKNLSVPYNIYYGPTKSALNGRIGGLSFSPTDPNTIYMAAPAGGIWVTRDRGVTWRALGNGFNAPYFGPISVSPVNPRLILAGSGDRDGGTGSGNGILRSTDGGETWSSISVAPGSSVSEIVFDPSNANVVLAAISEQGGLYRSTDAGATWTPISINGQSQFECTDVAVGAADSNGNRLFITRTRDRGLHISTDRGATWTQVSEPGSSAASRNHVDLSHLTFGVAYYSDENEGKIYKGVLQNGNFVWSDISAGFPGGYNWSQSWYDHHLTVATHRYKGQLRDFVYVGLITISAWDGEKWRDIGKTYTNDPQTHNDQHCMAVFPGNENRMVIGNDGGVYPMVYNSNTDAWEFEHYASRELGITMFYEASWHPTDPFKMFGGTQDNASPVSIGNIANWNNVTGGDGMGNDLVKAVPDIAFGSSQFNGLYFTTDFWKSQNFFGPPDDFGSDRVPFVTRMAVDQTAPYALYVGTNFLNRFNFNGTWNQRLGNVNLAGGGTVYSISVAPSDPNVIYVSTNNGRLWRSGDKGATWRRLDTIASLQYPGRLATAVSVHPTNPNDVLVTFSGFNSTNPVRRIPDASATNPVMTSVSGVGVTGLPPVSTFCITRDDREPATTFYVGTNIGVFGTTDGGTTWQNMTLPFGLPISEVNAIEWVPGTGFLNIATYGRGMWRINLRDVSLEKRPQFIWNESLARVRNRYTASFTITNIGRLVADDIRINSATLSTTNGPGTPTTKFSLRVGSLNYYSTTSFQVNFTGPNQRGIATATINGTYRLGGQTINFSRTVTQPGPQ